MSQALGPTSDRRSRT